MNTPRRGHKMAAAHTKTCRLAPYPASPIVRYPLHPPRRTSCRPAASAAPTFASRRSCSAATCSAGRPTRRVLRAAGPARRGRPRRIDTADIYSAWAPGNKGGESETIIGEWLKQSGKRGRPSSSPRSAAPGGQGRSHRRVDRQGWRSIAERLKTDGSIFISPIGPTWRRLSKRRSAPISG